MASNEDGGHWKDFEDRQALARNTKTADASPKKKWGWGRVILMLVVIMILGVGVLVAAAPAIAGAMAPGIVAGQTGLFNGTATISSASFGWGGPQRIENIKIADKNKNSVASIKSIEITAGLFDLIRGNLDVGTVTISGVKADVVKDADGKTNVEKLAPTAPAAKASKSDSPMLPEGLRAKVVIKGVAATYTDPGSKGGDGKPLTVSMSNLNANAKVAPGESLKLDIDGETSDGGTKAGSINITATIDKWSSKAGKITTDAAQVEAKAQIKNFPMALIDALAPGLVKDSSIHAALGDLADLSATISGGLGGGDADITVDAPNASAKAKIKVASNTLTTSSPIEVKLSGKALAALAPTLKQSLKDQNATLDAMPDASLAIDKLKFTIPASGAPVHFKGSGAVITANLTQSTGTVKLEAAGLPQPFIIAPLSATIDAQDLGGMVKVSIATNAQLSGQPAGDLKANITTSGLLDKSDAFVKGMPADLQGDISIRGMATAIAQPFVHALKLDLPTDVGPTLDANIKIATDPKAPSGSPIADIDLNVQGQFLKIVGGLRYAKEGIKTRGDGLRIDAPHAAAMAGRFMPATSGFSMVSSRTDSKGMTVVIKSLDVPMTAKSTPDMKKAAADVSVALEGVSLVPMVSGKPGAPVDIQTMAINLGIIAGGNLKASVDSSIWHESAPFNAVGAFDISGLLTNDKDGNPAVAMDTMKPVGNLELRNVPVSIARLAPSQPGADGKPALDLVKLLKGVVGPNFTVALNAKGAENAAGAYDVGLTMRSERVTADVSARGSSKQVDLKTFGAQANVAPETVRGLMETFAPTVTGAPQLTSASVLKLTVDPLTIPINASGQPDFASVGTATMKLNLPGRTLVKGLTSKNPDGTTRDLGEFGLQDFVINATAPVAAMMGPAAPGQRAVKAKLAGMILGGDNAQAIGVLDGDLSTEMSDKALAGALSTNIKLTQINVKALERIVGQAGTVSGAIGDTATVQATADIKPPADAASGKPFDLAKGTTTAQLSIDAPKLKSDGPLSATISPDAIRLNKSSKFTLDVDPAWANTFLKPKPGPNGKPVAAAMTMKEIAPINITLDKFTFPRADASGKSTAKLEAALGLAISRMVMQTADGQNLSMGATTIAVQNQAPGASGTPVDFSVKVADVTLGAKGAATGMSVSGTVNGIIDAAGNVDASKATITSRGDLPAIPSALIDAFSTKDGTVVDALGPVASVKFSVERYPLSGVPAAGTQPPVIDMNASSDRATASLKGTIRDGMYVSQAPFSAKIVEVTEKLSERFIKSLPLFGSFEKTKQDQPATLDVTNITAALGNEPAKLNADIVFDPGEARFGTSSFFGEALKIIKSRTEGQVGKKLEPLKANVRSGVLTYERWKVPLGEFTVETEGTVNLVTRQLDVVTYVPIAAVSDKVLGSLNLGVGGAVNKILPGAVETVSQVPFRTRGSMDDPKTAVDPELMLKNVTKTLDPKRILKDNLGDLLKPKTPTPTVPPK